jgi:acetolactate decarboxylase
MEDDFSEKLLQTDPKTNFTVTELSDFEWNPVLKNDLVKTDILNKYTDKCSH